MKIKSVLFVLGVFVSSNSLAFVNCFGKVNSVYVHKNGEVVLHTTWKNGYHAVCSMTNAWKGVPIEVCKGWLSIAQTAQVAKVETVIQYGSLDACADVKGYSEAEAPNYLMLYTKP